MSILSFDGAFTEARFDEPLLEQLEREGTEHLNDLYTQPDTDGVKGWLEPMADGPAYRHMLEKAAAVRADADVFVIVGVGGSNQAARAVIKALQPYGDKPEILYLGNTLSPAYIASTLARLEGKSVYINVIAKNFETLEPGSHFRILREYMGRRYDKAEMAKRVILTGTYGSRLEEIATENGYTFLEFPVAVGGRYSALTPVGLFPMAVAGIDVHALLRGGQAMKTALRGGDPSAVRYAALRNACLRNGFDVEVLAFFEPRLHYFAKWWVQLFGESEGKDKQGIFPAEGCYSEDLHSLGQYMQDGRRNLLETFIRVADPGSSVIVRPDSEFRDGFDYLDNKDFGEINRCAEQATIEAHTAGDVPCMTVDLERIDAESMGALFYFFMVACAVSGQLMGVNPFDQEGVEEYKRSMFRGLGK
ncbi:glucose-6-phosphate isomerase [Ruminococcaceae bacterium OttesenSCG-928-L11]|nr:glucose-6-phosphate isomerase [Ruminococcaceae bacterium OttesenSCG-928-L11]